MPEGAIREDSSIVYSTVNLYAIKPRRAGSPPPPERSRLTSSAVTHTHNQGLEFVHHNTYYSYDLL